MTDPDSFDRAVALHAAGRLAEAEVVCRGLIASPPAHPAPLLLLGIIRAQSGDLNEALQLIRRSLGMEPRQPLGHFWHAVVLAQSGQIEEAIRSYQRTTELAPEFAEAHYNRGQLLLAARRAEEALAAFDRTLALRPDLAEAQCVRAVALAGLDRRQEALAALDRVLAHNPHYLPAINTRSELNGEAGRFTEALADSDRSLAIDANQVAALTNRGNALFALRRLPEAEQTFERALALDPNAVKALAMCGIIHAEYGRCAQSVADLERASVLAPNDAMIHTNLGNALRILSRHDQALQAFNRALSLDPKLAKAYHGRAVVFHKLGQMERAMADCERAIGFDPTLAVAAVERFHLASLMCDWRERGAMIEDLARRIRQGEIVFPWLAITAFDDPELQSLAARHVAEPAVPATANTRAKPHARLRIAYLSPDFHDHPVAYQLVELFERHDKAKFETYGICLHDAPDSAIRTRISRAFDHFEEVGSRSDPDVANLLRSREIDIAIDLAGHTEGSRPRIFAFRPAPVAVNYVGYPGTIGSAHIDYILADAVAIPPAGEAFFSEKVGRLPDCFFPADTLAPCQVPPTRAEAGLPDKAFVFCAFNNAYKLSPEMFDIWMRLLRAIDGSVLWLSVANGKARANLRNEARARGVTPDRLVFAQRVAERQDHLARLALADLYLDTSPYNAHSTASDMLWAGVPLVTCAGRSLAARVAASLLTTIRLEELIAADAENYAQIALELAQSPERMAAIRAKLAANRVNSPLFDMARLTRQIESAYQTMWKRHSEGLPPAAFDVRPV